MKAANDNKPRYRGTLPLLNWLRKYHPELADAVARALRNDTPTDDGDLLVLEVRPSVAELVRAASRGEYHRTGGASYSDPEWQELGSLKFYKGRLTEWGRTAKGTVLKPVERLRGEKGRAPAPRNLRAYIDIKAAIASPLRAEPLQRPLSGEPAIAPMYDPTPSAAQARDDLAKATANTLKVPTVTRYPPAIAKGAEFMGGLKRPKAGASAGARMWEAPERPRAEAEEVLDEIASGGTLKSLAERLGLTGVRADRKAREALIETGRILAAANDNILSKVAA